MQPDMCLAVPGQVLAVQGDDPLLRTATVGFGSVTRQVSLAFLPQAVAGDAVLVHAGIAIARLQPGTAAGMVKAVEDALQAGAGAGAGAKDDD
jgi:hydrogenase expression/formation protein HypC